MAFGEVGTTVDHVAGQLKKMIRDGRGGEVLWVDPPTSKDGPATLYVGLDEDDMDEVAEVDYNG